MRVLLYFIFISFLSGCGQDASTKILFKNNLEDYESRKLHLGDPIQIVVEGETYDSIQVLLNGKVMKESFDLAEENAHFGINLLKLIIHHGKTEKMEREVSILVLPKEVPIKKEYEVVNRYKHDPANFTQGFHYEDGLVYEGTGLRGSSKIEVYDLETGLVNQSKKLEDRFFGEGITKVGDSVFQITYTSQKAFVYNAKSLERMHEFSYPYSAEGWGLCFSGEYLIMSNGSHLLYFINPKDFSLHHTIQVVDNNGVRNRLNELEYHAGRVYANVWYDNALLEINPVSGVVTGVIQLPEIPVGMTRENVANGIAFKGENLLVTGKNWPTIYELKRVKPINL
tara:strand:+ start:187 stop:1206 length:1020 start_codon:yes stop_codon:yes gene_type:complete